MTVVLHISPSGLAGAPGMLSHAQAALAAHETMHFRFGDYGPGRDTVSINTIPVRADRDFEDLFAGFAERADIIHVHNYLPRQVLFRLARIGAVESKTFIYQVHSPFGERPLYRDVTGEQGVRWAAKLAVAHTHPRMYPEFTPVPNCLYRPGLFKREPTAWEGEAPISVLYSPSDSPARRWAAKSSPSFNAALADLSRQPWARTRQVTGMPPDHLLILRRAYQIHVDEVVTGGFHMVSYEAMASGAIPINNADLDSRLFFAASLGTSQLPPFVTSPPESLVQVIHQLARDPDRLHAARLAAHEYFWENLNPPRVVGIFDRLYQQAG